MIADLIVGVQKRIWLIALTYFLALTVTVLMLMRQVPVYRCSATVELPMPQNDETDLQYQTRIATRLTTATASDVIVAARKELNQPLEEVQSQLRRLSADSVEGTSIIILTVDSLNPLLGTEFANAWATALLESLPEKERIASRIVERAVPPSRPTTPRKLQSLFFASMIGLIVGLILAGGLTIMEVAGRKEIGEQEIESTADA